MSRHTLVTGIRWFRYVPFRYVEAYKAVGWTYDGSIMHAPHGFYSVLMEWRGVGDPLNPKVFEP